MKTVKRVLFICLFSLIFIFLYGRERLVCAYAYYEIDVELGFDNQAKYGRYIPVEIKIYSEEAFEGTISLQRNVADSTQVSTYSVSVEAQGTKIIRTWIPLFEKNRDYVFVLKNSEGEEIARNEKSIKVLSEDYTELFVGILDESGIIKKLFNEINLGEYSSTTFPYILTRAFELDTSIINSDFEYNLDCLDIIVVMDSAMQNLSDDNIKNLLAWVESGNTLIVECAANLRTELVDIYNEAYMKMEENDELRPGLWMPKLNYGNGNISFLLSQAEERDFIAFVSSSSKELIGNVLSKSCSVKVINDIINYDMYYANKDDSYVVQYMLNSIVGKPIPDIREYIIVIALYILFVGPVVYLLFHKKKRSKYIVIAVSVLAIVFSCIIYRKGQDTRFTDMFLQYANLVNIEDDGVQEHTYICANVPYKDTYYLQIPSDYSVMPLIKMQNDTKAIDVNENGRDYIELVYTDADTKVIIQNKTPFSREYIETIRNHSSVENWQVDVDINYYDGLIHGKITNYSDKNYKQAALIMYGKIVLLGEIMSGESIAVDNVRTVTLPYYPGDVAQRITGLDEVQEETNSNTHVSNRELSGKTGVLEYIFNKYFDEKNTKAVFVGFTDESNDITQYDDRYEVYGYTVVYQEVEIGMTLGNLLYEPLHYTSVINADNNSTYDAYSNTTYGSRVRLQYKFEKPESIIRIVFEQGKKSDNIEDAYYENFSGIVYFYNNKTLVYDKIDISKGHFYISEIEDYLLDTGDGYTLTVQYNISTTGQYRYTEIKMPDVAVVRRIDYVESIEP